VGTTVAWSAPDGIWLMDYSTPKALRTHIGPSYRRGIDFRFSPDGKYLALFGGIDADGKVRREAQKVEICEAATTDCRAVTLAEAFYVSDVEFDPKSSMLACIAGKKFRIFRVSDLKRLASLQAEVQFGEGLTWSSAGDRVAVAVGSTEGGETIHIYDALTGQRERRLKGFRGKVIDTYFSPKDDLVISAHEDGVAKVWNLSDQVVAYSFKARTAPLKIIDVSDKQGLQLTAATPSEIVKWTLPSPSDTRVVHRFSGEGSAVLFSPSGKYLVAASSGIPGVLLETEQWLPLANLSRHGDSISSMVFSPDETLLATGSLDRSVILWSTQSGQPVREPLQTRGQIRSLAFSPDAKLLAAMTEGTSVSVWSIPLGTAGFSGPRPRRWGSR